MADEKQPEEAAEMDNTPGMKTGEMEGAQKMSQGQDQKPPELELGTPTDASTSKTGSAASAVSLESVGGKGKVDGFVDRVGEFFSGRAWLAAVFVGILLILFLLLPPVSLAERFLGNNGYTALDSETPTTNHPDGLTVKIDPEAVEKLRVQLSSVPRADFLSSTEEDKNLAAARDAIPDYLSPKSPYYTIETRDEDEGPVVLEVVIPNEAEPWETLDLYTWDGESWQWLPAQLDRDQELLISTFEQLPKSVMVMQSEQVQITVVAESQDLPTGEVHGVLEGVDLVGMKIGTLGEMTGDPALLPPGNVSDNPALAPTVRNWAPERMPNRVLVADMLNMEADRATHLERLAALVEQGQYAGLVLDYRGLTVEDREPYAGFVEDLAAALHEQGDWLAVTVEAPTRNEGGTWDTAGFDWVRIGAAADQVRMVMPLEPRAYAPGGLVEQMLTWATSRVNRYKLYPIFSTMCTDGEVTLTMDEVLDSLGEISAAEELPKAVQPGTELIFELAGGASMETDALTGATLLKTEEGEYWLGTPQWLRSRLDLVSRYHLGGVALCDLLNNTNLEGMAEAISNYEAQVAAIAYSAPDVVWVTKAPDGSVSDATLALRQAQYNWVAPDMTGTYTIAATVSGIDRGSLEVEVAAPVAEDGEGENVLGAASREEGEGEIVEGETPDEEPEDSDTETTETSPAGLRAAFVADVTVPDNTRFEKGEKFTKTWRLRNAGSEAWPEDTALAFVSGEQMTDASQVPVGAVEPGAEVEISVELTAPDQDGRFRGDWGLSTGGGSSISGGRIYVQIQAGEEAVAEAPEPESPAAPPAPAPVVGGAFELGGHIPGGFENGDLMHYAGMNWAKVQVRYPNDASGIIAAAHANGFKIQVSALGGSGMVTQGGFNETVANWMAGIAAAGADAIEVWNEPNLPREWQEGHINPNSYTQLLCASYSAIKAANPNAAVISAAPAPTGYFGGCHPHGCDDIPWLQGLYNAGAANCMDYIGAHHNAGATAPSATSGHPADNGGGHHSWYFLPQTQIYYNIFGGSRQLFYTELGYVTPEGYGWIPGTFSWGGNTTVAQQAQWLSEVVQLSSQTGMVRVVIVWNVG
ncbi:MAG: NBR1-Ig-like domain-containing protein, partial [Anaerolineae bacterium]